MRWSLVLLVAACGSDGAASPDAAIDDDASATPDGAEAPIEFDVPLETWTWLDVPGMVCGNGSPTGIAINPTQRSNKLVVMFEGGGACWEAAACYGILIPVTASHLDGFSAATFEAVRPSHFDNVWAFQRDDPASLFADATWVFVPYCTGDLHAGTRDNVYEALGQTRTMHHQGASNVDAMLARIDDYSFSEVFAMGISAGGYGVQLNWDRISAAFPDVTTHIFADGSQMVPLDGRWGTMNAVWAPRLPAGCTDCAVAFDRTPQHWRESPIGGRYGLTASLQDPTLSLFFGYDTGGMRAQSLIVGNAMTGSQAAFMIDESSHTMLAAPEKMTSTGVTLRAFVEGWARDTASFATAGP